MPESSAIEDGLPDLLSARPRRRVEEWLASQQLSLEDLRRRDRTPETVEARSLVIRYLRRHGWSLNQIGRYLDRDHTTILHHLQKEIA